MIILGLGCNIGDRLANLREALEQLEAISEIKVNQVSPIYESDALLTEEAKKTWNLPYLNLALSITTKLNPQKLLVKIKAIEEKMGRLKSPRWSPRVMDIDILTWNDESYHTDKLNIPHEGLLDRPFALWPVADLSPTWKYCEPNKVETGKSAEELAKKFGTRFDGNAPLHTKQINHRIDTPIMVGILNVTTDSFSDGGKFINLEDAVTQIKNLFKAGADIIDIGAESTRPVGAIPIIHQEEWKRLQPILDAWCLVWENKSFKPKLSVDTNKPETIKKLLPYEIDFLNDVTGLNNSAILELMKISNAKIIFMHSLSMPANTKNVISSDLSATKVVYQWGKKQLEKLVKFGIEKERLIFDVGIGFGKTAEQSFELIKNISKFHQLDVPLLVGHSRKSFLNRFVARPFDERDIETAAVSAFLTSKKVKYLRVHDVDQNMRLLKIKLSFDALC